MSRNEERLSLDAHAKINLGLRVLAREASGYHQIETMFARVSLADRVTLTLTESSGVRLEVQGDVGGVPHEENLAVRAAQAYLTANRADRGVDILLEKSVPVGAGMGGGSADAAATLVGLDRLFGARLGQDRLRALAATLGSDVPFLVEETPLALAWGRGERLIPRMAPGPAWVILAMPSIQVDTGWAYRTLSANLDPGVTGGISYPVGWVSWAEIAGYTDNAFEPVVYRRHPELARLRGRLEAEAPLAARMTGTGAAHYALYDSEPDALRALSNLKSDLGDIRLEVAGLG